MPNVETEERIVAAFVLLGVLPLAEGVPVVVDNELQVL